MERFLTSKSLKEIMFNILDICIISRSLSLYNIAFFRGITLKGCCVKAKTLYQGNLLVHFF